MMTCCALLIGPYAIGSSPRQNIVFIAVDDLGNVISSARGPAHTPSLDRLAGTGVRFDRAYCQIPLCNPGRASVLTGRRPDETCVYDLARNFRSCLPGVVTLPQFFRRHGWTTARVGKIYHYDVPNEIGTNGMDDPASWDQVMNPKGRDVADQALITNPTPFVAPKRYFESHPLKDIRLPSSSTQARENLPSAAFAHNNTTPHYGLDELTCWRALQAYCASVSFVDAQIGRIVAAVEQSGLADQTIIVVWSDNGYHLGKHGRGTLRRNL
jgi:uncharacterized sulfatase